MSGATRRAAHRSPLSAASSPDAVAPRGIAYNSSPSPRTLDRPPRFVTAARILVHTSRQPLRWADMDMLGHVNNVGYFRFMEQARIEWLHAQPEAGGLRDGQLPVIANASCNFRVPLVYPGVVEVRMWLGEPGRTSLGSFYELWMNDILHADGAAKIVWIDAATGRPHPLPDRIAAPLRAAIA